MQHLDLQVIERALQWVNQGHRLWLCTVLATFGSSPREPGAMLVARQNGEHLGSLSGGCVEEDFLERLRQGEFTQPIQRVCYGGQGESRQTSRVRLPCGGRLEVLVEQMQPNTATFAHLKAVHATLLGRQTLIRHVPLDGSEVQLIPAEMPGPAIIWEADRIGVRIGPALRLIIAGISPVSQACASFANTLGFEVIVCDPRKEACNEFSVQGVKVRTVMPSTFIASGSCHAATAVVALTHDPRIDDLAIIEAVRTEAFYIGVMGSEQTSRQREARLLRSGGLEPEQVARVHMPIGLGLGSKTPAEIALAAMSDIVRVHRGRARDAL